MDELKGLTALEALDFSFCGRLTNVDGLRNLNSLQFLNMIACVQLKSVRQLHTVGSLKVIGLPTSITQKEMEELKSKLPEVKIIKGDQNSSKYEYSAAVKKARQ